MLYVKNLYNGRISRKYYAIGILFLLVPLIFLLVSFSLLPPETVFDSKIIGILLVFLWLISVALFASLTVRRFHDLSKSGWKALTLIIPFVNAIIFFYLFFAKSKERENKYGVILPNNAKFFDVIFNRR